jgi:hypothetical protein
MAAWALRVESERQGVFLWMSLEGRLTASRRSETMPMLDELRGQNEQIEAQMQEWQQQRFANGENPMDWVAFRQHLQQLGAPDPGESAPDEFLRWDESLVGGTPDPNAGTSGAYSKSRDVPADEIQGTSQ